MKYLTRKKFWPLLRAVDAIGTKTRRVFRVKPLPPVNKIKRMLIIRIDEVGDIVLANPIISALAAQLPHAAIDMLVKPNMKDFVAHHPQLNAVYTLQSHLKGNTSVSLLRKSAKQLRENHYDVVFDLHIDARNLYLAHKIGGAVLGYAERGLGFLISRQTPYKEHTHVIDVGLELVKTLTGKSASRTYDFYVHQPSLETIKQLLHEKKIAEKGFVILNPGAGRANKLWIEQKWAQLADSLVLSGESVVFIGTPQEVDMSERIVALMKQESIMLTGTTSLNEAAALISLAKGLISTDSGPVHIARFTKTPLVALFGPVDPAVWGYDEPGFRSVFVKLYCSFCNEGKCNNNPNKDQCMKDISVQAVLDTWKQVIREAH